jgi:hypothetical protein
MAELSSREKARLRAEWSKRAKVIVCGFTTEDAELAASVACRLDYRQDSIAREFLALRLVAVRWMIAGSDPGAPDHFLDAGLREEMEAEVLQLLRLDKLERDPAGWLEQRENFYGTPVRHDGPVKHTMELAGRLFASCLGHADKADVCAAGEKVFTETVTLLLVRRPSLKPKPGFVERLIGKLGAKGHGKP